MRSFIICLICFICFSFITPPKLYLSDNSPLSFHKDSKSHSLIQDTLKPSLLMKFAKTLSFGRNIKEKANKNIAKIAKANSAKDSVIFAKKLEKLNSDLLKNQNQKFDSLSGLIKTLSNQNDSIKKEVKKVVASTAKKTTSNEVPNEIPNSLDDEIPQDYDPLPEETKVLNTDIDDLIEKIVPRMKEKETVDESKEEKQKKIRAVRLLLNHPEGINDTIIVNDSTSQRYRLKLSKNGEVFGYHPYWMNNRFPDYNFKLLSTLAYYGYELDGRNGGYISINGWEEAAVVPLAKKHGCKVVLSVFASTKNNLSSFLRNKNAQRKFSATVIKLLKLREANGVNIILESPGGDFRHKITDFLITFSSELKQADSSYTLSVTLPCLDKNADYDIKELEASVDFFIIDFSKKNDHGAIVPIDKSPYSLESGIGRYLNKAANPKQFIACLPFRGAMWDFGTKKFEEYVPYKRVSEDYMPEHSIVHEPNGTARIDFTITHGNGDKAKTDTIRQLWFDDAQTISEKYDFILQNDLGGIAIWTLGDDGTQVDMSDAIMDKMFSVDTSDFFEIKKPSLTKAIPLTFLQKVKLEFNLYREIFEHPCQFVTGSKRKEELILDDFIGHVALVFLVILTTVVVYTIIKSRALGDDWSRKKLFLGLIITLIVWEMFIILLYIFLNPSFEGIGIDDTTGNCEVSFATILAVLTAGFTIGTLAMKFVLLPLLKPKEIP